VAFVAIVLAAGRGTRFGSDKLAARIGGRSVLERSVEIALAAPVERVIVVTASPATAPTGPRIESVAPGGPALSDSLRAGVAAAGDADGAFIFLGDMPLVPPGLAAQLLDAIGSAVAALPVRDSAPGHPVLLARAGLGLVEHLHGDVGLGQALRGREDIVRLATSDPGASFDIDVPADLAAAQRLAESR
jgi:molybdenum cofactor cytidylyltransferase